MDKPLDAAALAGWGVAVWGCAGHAAVLLDLLAHHGLHVRAFLDQQATEPLVPGVPLFAQEKAWLG